MTRRNLGQNEVVRELTEDKERYQVHPDCDALVCFVYDPMSYCTNPAALEDDVSEEGHGLLVRVVVGPRGRWNPYYRRNVGRVTIYLRAYLYTRVFRG